MRRLLALAAAIAALHGCATFNRDQVSAFVDGGGRVLRVEYGTRSSPYTYYIVSPVNGNRLECHDDKMVKLEMPDGSRYVCYICQNEIPKGTMYSTRDNEIRYLTIGFQSRVYKYVPERNDYLEIFDGQLSPQAVK
jgi:hypothetical protein